ncbi:MAG: pyridoxal-5'-phosphate-dependent protein subunit beta [Phototrophicales bacterium]|nr:MAG: pyridoxal-5'-phosphate-dependent protein subunit beta [Phototrophicales bacterium]
MTDPQPIALDEIVAARDRIRDYAIRTPLIRLNIDDTPAEIYLKLENLQPIGAFKVRGAANAILSANPEALTNGIFTASAGNMAQGVGYVARQLGLPFQVVVPDHAPQAKLSAIERLGGAVIKVPFDEWWQVLLTRQYAGLSGFFVHPVSDPAVMAGNGTIGLEILQDLPDADVVIIPFGGGGLSSGIASAIHALKPNTKIYASEVNTSAALSAALKAQQPTRIEYVPSFVDGIGSGSVLPEMWPLVRQLLTDSIVVSLEQVAEAIRLLIVRNRVIAEGAGASSVAAALTGQAGVGKIVCVVSGGNIDATKIAAILQGQVP